MHTEIIHPLGKNYLSSKQKLSTLYSVIITLLPTRICILLVVNNIRVRLSILTIEKGYILLDYNISISEQQQRMNGVTRKQEEDRIQKRENG